MKHRNIGAPFKRADGTVWGTNAVFEPTEDELRRKRYKLRAVGMERPEHLGWARDRVDQPPPQDAEWPLQMSPEKYLQIHPEGQHAEAAKKLVKIAEAPPSKGEAQEEAPDGSPDD